VDEAALQRHLQRRLRSPAPVAWLHGEVARRMAERLGVIKLQPQAVIDWWATLGGSELLLRQHYPQAQYTGIEPATLLHLAPTVRTPPWWQRPWSSRPQATRRADDAEMPATGQLMWSNMMLHWVNDLPALFGRWHAALGSDGFMMFSCFGPDTLRELRDLYAECGWRLPASPFIDMHDLGDVLVHAGFADPVMDMEMLTLSWHSADALLAELRTLGGNTAPQREAGLRTPRWRARLAHLLTERLADGQGRLRLSFEIIYGHAFRPAPRPKLAPTTEVSLDTMREMVRRPRGQGLTQSRP
jgi:malonyl-CoA O-methyltransferase